MVSFIAILLVLCVCEAGLRIAGISYPGLYTSDDELGHALRPGSEGWSNKEGNAFVRINSVGMRDRDHSIVKPPGTFRIAILGDSYAEAKQVDSTQTFWAAAERELESCIALSTRRPEVLNFGVSGYGTAQELLMLRQRVWRYEPDLVVLAFVTGNDVRNNSRELEQEKLRPYFQWQDGQIVSDLSFRDTPEFQFRQSRFTQWKIYLADHIRLFQVLSEGLSILRDRFFPKRRSPAHAETQAAVSSESQGQDKISLELLQEAGLDMSVYREPHDLVWEAAWRVTEALVVTMAAEVRQRGADFLLMTLSNAPQVHPNPAVRLAFARRLGVEHLFYPDLRIRDLASRQNIPILSLAPPLQTVAEQHQIFLHGFTNTQMGIGHWNAEGHRLAGQLLAQTLCAQVGPRLSPQPQPATIKESGL